MQEEELKDDLNFEDNRPENLGMGNFEDESQL
jgi:hypothetical protein